MRRLRAVAAVVVAGALTAGCASPRAALGPNKSTCFPALSEAAQILNHAGRFAGVTLTHVPERAAGATTTTPSSTGQQETTQQGTTTTLPHRDFCLVAYKGTFDASTIPLVQGQERTGQYAIVVVTAKTHRVVAVFLRDQLPRAFHHL